MLLGLDYKKIREVEQYGIIGIKRTENVQEMVELYNGALAVTSLSYEETFGLTIVEGLACGVPGIIYNVAATPELITPETGIAVMPGDIRGISEAIYTVNINGKEQYSAKCRERAVSLFNKEEKNEEYLRLYEDVSNKMGITP